MMKNRAIIYFLIVISASIIIFITAAAQEQPCDHVIPVGPWVNNAVIRATEDETVCLRTGWAAMNYGLANAYTKKVKIAYSLTNSSGFEDVYGPQKGGWEDGGEIPIGEAWNCPGKWSSGEETGHVFWWIHRLGYLTPGEYSLDFATTLKQPVKDPCDTDGDGKRPDSYTGFAIQAELKIYASDGLGSLSGKVREQFPDGSMGAPIQGIQWVSACKEEVPPWKYGESEFCGYSETDENGEYHIAYLEPGFYRVVIWGPEWVGEFYDDKAAHDFENADLVLVEGGSETINIDFSMVRAGFISGTVTDEGTGMPIPEIWVGTCREDVPEWEYGESEFCNGGESDESGYYEIPGLFPGNYRVVIWHPEWLGEFYDDKPFFDDADLVPVNAGEMTGGVDFALESAGIISGMVTDSEDPANPIPWVWVDACHESVPQELWGSSPLCSGGGTDEFGYYEIPGLVPGAYRVQIWHPEWLGEFYNDKPFYENADLVLVNPGATIDEVDFILEPAGIISGRVTNYQNGEGIPGIWVDTCEEAVSSEDMWGQFPFCGGDDTDEEGYYTIPGLIPGNYRVHVWDPLWLGEFYDDASTFDDALLVTVVGGPDPLVIDFALTQAGTVSGMVFESDGITPIPNIGVDVVEGGHGACADQNGYYMIGSLPFGTYDIVAGRDFCGVGGYAETIVEDIIVSLETPHVVNLDFNLEQAASISGMVVDTFGHEIVGIWVEVNDFYTYDWAGGASTDSEGNYFVSGLTQGDYRICIWDQSWVHQCYNMALPGTETRVTLVSGEQREEIDFTLTKAGSISGNVIDEGEIPIVGIGVGACSYDELDPVCYGNSTDNQGNYTLSGMIPDEYLVFVWGQEGWVNELFDDNVETPVLVEAGLDSGGINFTLSPAGSISGTVLDIDWQPVTGVLVEVNEFYTYAWVDGAETDVDGNYYVPSLAAGDYRACIWHPEWVHQCYDMTVEGFETLIALGAGENRDDIHFVLTTTGP